MFEVIEGGRNLTVDGWSAADRSAARELAERHLREDPFLAELVARFDAHRRSFELPPPIGHAAPRNAGMAGEAFKLAGALLGRVMRRPRGKAQKRNLLSLIFGA